MFEIAISSAWIANYIIMVCPISNNSFMLKSALSDINIQEFLVSICTVYLFFVFHTLLCDM